LTSAGSASSKISPSFALQDLKFLPRLVGIACRTHSNLVIEKFLPAIIPERTEEELNILVDHGVKVIDVIVEHPLYGELRGSLMIESRADVQDFLQQVRAKKAS